MKSPDNDRLAMFLTMAIVLITFVVCGLYFGR